MEVCCTPEFRDELLKLRKNGSYADIEAVLVDAYCDATFAEANTGDLLAAMPGMNYLKKRVEGRGGFRFYLLAVVKGEKIYLGFVHPKTGRYGADNVTPEKKKIILREILMAVKTQKLLSIKRDENAPSRAVFTDYELVDRA